MVLVGRHCGSGVAVFHNHDYLDGNRIDHQFCRANFRGQLGRIGHNRGNVMKWYWWVLIIVAVGFLAIKYFFSNLFSPSTGGTPGVMGSTGMGTPILSWDQIANL
jgi:hypothetical protein